MIYKFKDIALRWYIQSPSVIEIKIDKKWYELKTLPEPFSGYDFTDSVKIIQEVKEFIESDDIDCALQYLITHTKLRYGDKDKFRESILKVISFDIGYLDWLFS